MPPQPSGSESTPLKRLPTTHIPALDGLRGLAVLAVIVFHLAAYAQPESGLGSIIHSMVRFGWVGVDLFFVLSGFLITGILYDNRNAQSRFRGFYGRRLLRIAPLYYAGLALYVLVASFIATPADAAALYDAVPWHSAYLTNIRISLAGTWAAAPMQTGHLWSLAVEEQFYLLWPALIAATVRWTRSPRSAMMWICGVIVLASIGFRLWVLPESPLGAYTLLPARTDALAMGALLALWVRGPAGASPAIAASKPVAIVCGLALLGMGTITAGTYSYLNPLQQGAGYTLWAALFAAILVRAAVYPGSRLSRSLVNRPLTETGKISYGLYLIHFPVMFVLQQIGALAFGFVPFCLGVVVVSFVLATLSWRYLESPMLRLKRFFPYDGTRQTSTARIPGQIA